MPAHLPALGQEGGQWGDTLNTFVRSIVFNVQDYQADPTGSDANAATTRQGIQNAIDAAVASGNPGGVVYLPQGTYVVDNAINLKSGIILRGAGYNTVIKKKSSSGSFTILRDGAGQVQKVTIENLRIDGNKSGGQTETIATEAAQGGIHLYSGATENIIRNIWVENTMHSGIYLGGAGNTVVDCTIKNIGTGGNTLGKSGIVTDNSGSSTLLARNVISNVAEIGLAIFSGGTASAVSDNRIDNCGVAGIHVLGSNCVTITGNTVSTCRGAGLLIGAAVGVTSNPSNSCAISMNTVSGTTGTPGHGIYLNQGNYHSVFANVTTGNTGTGVIFTNITYSSVTGNVVSGNAAGFTTSGTTNIAAANS